MKLAFTILLPALICAMLCSCRSGRSVAGKGISCAQADAINLASVGQITAGPAGVMSSDTGFTWILPRTNRYFYVETKDVLHNTVVRYLHDREVYGDSLVIWPGPIDAEHHPELPDTLNPAAYFRTRFTTNTP